MDSNSIPPMPASEISKSTSGYPQKKSETREPISTLEKKLDRGPQSENTKLDGQSEKKVDSIQTNSIKLVKFTPTSKKWEKPSSGSAPGTPVRRREQSTKPLPRSQSLKLASLDSIPLPGVDTEGRNNEEKNDKLLGLLRSKNAHGNFLNLTMSKEEMAAAPKSYSTSTREFISSNNTARIRTSPVRKEITNIDVNKLAELRRTSSPRDELKKEERSNESRANNMSFSSSVEELLRRRKVKQQSRIPNLPFRHALNFPLAVNPENSELAKKNAEKYKLHKPVSSSAEDHDQTETVSNDLKKAGSEGRDVQVQDAAEKESIAQTLHTENLPVIKSSKVMETQIRKGATVEKDNIQNDEEKQEVSIKENSNKSTTYKDGIPSASSASLAAKPDMRNIDDESIRKSKVVAAFEEHSQLTETPDVSHSKHIILQTPMKRHENSSTFKNNNNSAILKSLKAKWKEILQSEDPYSGDRAKELVKFFGDTQVGQERIDTSQGRSLLKMHPGITKADDLPHDPIFDGFRPTVVLTQNGNRLMSRNGVSAANTNSSNNATGRNPQNAVDHTNKQSPSKPPKVTNSGNSMETNINAIIQEPAPYLTVPREIPSEKIPKLNPSNSGTPRFSKIKVPHINLKSTFASNTNSTLASNTYRKSISPKISDPETETRKFNRTFPSSVLTKLHGKRRYGREIIQGLVQTGVAQHKPFSEDSDVSVTNDICSASNYEVSYAYYYQQLQRRGKLEYLTLDNPTETKLVENASVLHQPTSDSSVRMKHVMSSPEKLNGKSDIEGYSKEGWMKEWRSKLRTCTVYFDIPGSSEIGVPGNQTDYLKRIFEVDFGVKLAKTLNEHVDLMIINENCDGIDDRIPFSQTVTNAIPGVKCDKKLRVWNQAKAWQFIKNLGIVVPPFKSISAMQVRSKDSKQKENLNKEMAEKNVVAVKATEEELKGKEVNVEQQKEKEVEKRESEKRELEKRELEKRESEKRESEKRELEKRELEKRELEKRELEKRESEKRESEKRELEKRELEKRELEKRELEKTETEKRELEKTETEKRELEKKELEKKELERNVKRKEAERKEVEKKGIKREANEVKKAKVSSVKYSRNKNIVEGQKHDRGKNQNLPILAEPFNSNPVQNQNDQSEISALEQESDDEKSYLEGLLENASIITDAKDKQLEDGRRLVLKLSREVMLRELKITSLEGQLRSSQKEIEKERSTLEDCKKLLTEKDLIISEYQQHIETLTQNKRSRDKDDKDTQTKKKYRKLTK
ncbi:hypothetical protein HG535_0F04880 [Zygotorulaspora mrakii]|uniref:Sir4 SID domain-containing protein n=1 Tax=Zygotorulaspora mrakii TaxID=42260 RepID=A0A7H9B6M6_ZYGMR|nr:uncharacterized protein HG535_0F04880 [Zygotorulaspora mrakii]QLG73976.1 hypothetical protein HG535_0F04880 [Zygotorulaspora mrakii]